MNKPSVVSVIGERVELRRAGKEYIGLCPFHAEKTPSFTVNEDKCVFYCHGCHVGGDVIEFVKLIARTDYRGAVKILGIKGGEYRPKPVDTRKRRAAVALAGWLNRQHLLVGAMLRQLTRSLVIAEEIGASNLIELWQQEFDRLEILFDILQEPELATGLWGARHNIEQITARAPVEPLPEFPPWTPEYAAYLAAHLPALEVGN